MIVAIVGAGWPVYVDPKSETVTASDPVDAVLALGGYWQTSRLALEMVRDGEAGHAILSDPYGPDVPQMTATCPPDPPKDRTCFKPDPSTTRGEAMEIAKLAREKHGDNIAVIAPRYHIALARDFVERCYSGRLRMVDPDVPISPQYWVYQYAYQTGGYLKAKLFEHGC